MEDEILTVFERLIGALTQQRDADAAIALFAGDEDIAFWGSREDEFALGPTAVVNLLRTITGSTVQLQPSFPQRRVTVAGEAAWVNAVGEMRARTPGTPLQVIPYRITGIFVRRDDGWRWHTFSGSQPNPAT